MSKVCYCGSSNSYKECCEKFINSSQNAPTAEALMRSRYSAYATQAVDYLIATTAVLQRKLLIKSDILEWSQSNKWNKLEIIEATENTVEFKAYYTDSNNLSYIHHEKSTFIIEDGKWYYVDGEFY
jgi:SEC-C motif-containing protein